MGKRDLDNYEYDQYLTHRAGQSRAARQELEKRHGERRNKGYTGWHFGIGDRPVKTNSKEDFKRELDKRGLVMRDDVRKGLR